MSKPVENIEPPVNRAMVFICEKCGRRAGGSGKNPSHRLASKFKRLVKHEFEKGDIRIVLTSCMDICPEDRVAISVQPNGPAAPVFWVSDTEDLDASSEALMKAVHRLVRQS